MTPPPLERVDDGCPFYTSVEERWQSHSSTLATTALYVSITLPCSRSQSVSARLPTRTNSGTSSPTKYTFKSAPPPSSSSPSSNSIQRTVPAFRITESLTLTNPPR